MKNKKGRGWCDTCNAWTDSTYVDMGIGGYEYWGSLEYQHDWEPVCDYCGEIVQEFEENGVIKGGTYEKKR